MYCICFFLRSVIPKNFEVFAIYVRPSGLQHLLFVLHFDPLSFYSPYILEGLKPSVSHGWRSTKVASRLHKPLRLLGSTLPSLATLS